MKDTDGRPRLVVTADVSLGDRDADSLGRSLAAWLEDGGKLPLVIPMAFVHVAAEQPDGSWLRLCHDHAASVVKTAELV